MRWENLNAADEKRFVKDIHSIAKSLEGINGELHAMNAGTYKNDPVKDALESMEKASKDPALKGALDLVDFFDDAK